jgi:hypothetical protein
MYVPDTDVPVTRACHDINLCHTDVPVAGGLCRRAHRLVLQYFDTLSSSTNCGRSCSIQDSPQGSGSPVSKIVQTQAAPGQLSRTEITGRISDTQYPSSSTSHDGSYVGMDRQENLKPKRLSSDEDLERGEGD